MFPIHYFPCDHKYRLTRDYLCSESWLPPPRLKQKKKKRRKERKKKKGKEKSMTKLMNTKVVFLQRFQCARTRDSGGGGWVYIPFPRLLHPCTCIWKKNEFEDKIIYDITHSNRILNGMGFIIYEWQYVFVNLWNITLNIYFKDYCTLYFVRVIYWCYEVSAFIQNISITKCENTKTRAKWQKKTWKNQTKRFYLALILWLNTRRFINALIKEK